MNDFTQHEYTKALTTKSDINEHLPMLLDLANECETVTEFGVRTGISSRAFLNSKAKVVSYDIAPTPEADYLFNTAKMLGRDCEYIISDVLKIDIKPTDLLFIDTDHTYEQLKEELSKHHSKVKKYIVFHDTYIYGLDLLTAITEFMVDHPEWKYKYHTTENNGLTVLERSSSQVKKQNKKILIAIPTSKDIEAETFKSIYNLIKPDGYDVEFQTFYGYRVDQVRNLIAHWIEHNYDYLFAVDYDITFPPDTLVKLTNADKDIISGLYIQRKANEHILEVWDDHGPCRIEEISGKGIIPILACGFGCVLVKKEVFVKVGHPQFEYHIALDHKNTFSEDHDFCKKAREKGFTIWADTSIKCGHIGSYTYTVKDVSPPTVEQHLLQLRNTNLFPEGHITYLRKLSKTQLNNRPNVIYDIGACVLHWTDKARTIWPHAKYYAFEAMLQPRFIYEQAGLGGYFNGILTDKDNKQVEFYENVFACGGNSYYKENSEYSKEAEKYYPDSNKQIRTGFTLDTVVKNSHFPYPDLIKIDVQGAELDILKGADECLKHCYQLIIELQKVEYNKGAPRREEVIEYLKTKNFKLVGDGPFHDAGPDGDYHFVKDKIEYV